MAATTSRAVRKPARSSARPARLEVVRPDERGRTVGTISTMVALFFFALLFALAGLHAVVVQTQSELDDVNAEIAELEELRILTLAERVWSSSVEGLAAAATEAGYVPAPDVVTLAPVPLGRLTPPNSADPFGTHQTADEVSE